MTEEKIQVFRLPRRFGNSSLMIQIIKVAESKKQKILFLVSKKELVTGYSEMLLKNGITHGILNDPNCGNSEALVQLSCPETKGMTNDNHRSNIRIN